MSFGPLDSVKQNCCSSKMGVYSSRRVSLWAGCSDKAGTSSSNGSSNWQVLSLPNWEEWGSGKSHQLKQSRKWYAKTQLANLPIFLSENQLFCQHWKDTALCYNLPGSQGHCCPCLCVGGLVMAPSHCHLDQAKDHLNCESTPLGVSVRLCRRCWDNN